MPESKPCGFIYCPNRLTRRPDESAYGFRRRRFCSGACGAYATKRGFQRLEYGWTALGAAAERKRFVGARFENITREERAMLQRRLPIPRAPSPPIYDCLAAPTQDRVQAQRDSARTLPNVDSLN